MPPPGSARDAHAPLGDATNRWPEGADEGVPTAKRPRVSRPEPSEAGDWVASESESESEPDLTCSVAELYREEVADEASAEVDVAPFPRIPEDLSDDDLHPRDDSSVGPRGDSSDDATCPVCGSLLRDAADTAIARVAHVNACLDALEAGPEAGHSRTVLAALADLDARDASSRGEGEWHDVAAWAHAASAPPAFAEAVVRDRVTFARLEEIGDADLIAMGLATSGARVRLRAAVEARAERRRQVERDAEMSKRLLREEEESTRGRSDRGGGSAIPRGGEPTHSVTAPYHPTRVASAVAPVFAYAASGREKAAAAENAENAENAPPFPPKHDVRERSRSACAASSVLRGVRRVHVGFEGIGGVPPTRYAYTPAPPPLTPPPPWIRVPGTRFIVDGFKGFGKSHSGWCRNWFLTHFHADHYGGLTKSVPGPGCVVWCTRATAALCAQRLGVARERLRVADVGRPFVVDGVRCVFVDANHCPGAAMIVFHYRGPGLDDLPGCTSTENAESFGDGEAGDGRMESPAAPRPVIATGDCRWHEGMRRDPHLRWAAARSPALMLDTTYCDPKHAFPTQASVLASVRDAATAEASANAGRTLFLFGTYTIGKERVFFEAAEALGKKVYVGKQKMRTLDALFEGGALPARLRECVTGDDTRTNLHVVPMGSTSFARMKTILRYYAKRFDTVVAFKPTGWTFEQSRKHARATKRSARGALIQYAVPYSEHSSFAELREMVRFLKPGAILPHVGNDRGPKARRMVRLLTAPDDAVERLVKDGDGGEAAAGGGEGGGGDQPNARRT